MRALRALGGRPEGEKLRTQFEVPAVLGIGCTAALAPPQEEIAQLPSVGYGLLASGTVGGKCAKIDETELEHQNLDAALSQLHTNARCMCVCVLCGWRQMNCGANYRRLRQPRKLD